MTRQATKAKKHYKGKNGVIKATQSVPKRAEWEDKNRWDNYKMNVKKIALN